MLIIPNFSWSPFGIDLIKWSISSSATSLQTTLCSGEKSIQKDIWSQEDQKRIYQNGKWIQDIQDIQTTIYKYGCQSKKPAMGGSHKANDDRQNSQQNCLVWSGVEEQKSQTKETMAWSWTGELEGEKCIRLEKKGYRLKNTETHNRANGRRRLV